MSFFLPGNMEQTDFHDLIDFSRFVANDSHATAMFETSGLVTIWTLKVIQAGTEKVLFFPQRISYILLLSCSGALHLNCFLIRLSNIHESHIKQSKYKENTCRYQKYLKKIVAIARCIWALILMVQEHAVVGDERESEA